ncbi:acetylornithine carbamoyltransferase [Wenzhouxiangella marina]|uniref:N-acetylornithine carbamoyltransferase n=2 Tax=Wenzhouxiangella marina TaxID=1579979 RepID=A0A0K0XSB1_9GAMM|nr:acetylornithine carbamoyltransferase [Wenzhouxiangella marina]
MRHFLTTEDWTRPELQALLDAADDLRRQPVNDQLRGKTIALMFLNPSLRTRSSFEIGAFQLGAHAVVLEPGKAAWGIEFERGVVMDGDAEEHIAEVAGVLSRYCDAIALRAFPLFKDWSHDRQDPVIRALAEYASVPVINMETIVHPCQELALMRTIQDHLGAPDGRKFVLTWTWHPRPLNTAVANSALLIATKFGMDVTLLVPDDAYLLDEHFMDAAHYQAESSGGRFNITHNIEKAYTDADFVYAKSWGALPFYGRPEEEAQLRAPYRHFMVDGAKMALTRNARFSHCLPLRRNVKASDEVMDADYCVAIDEAENRLHVQKALMTALLNNQEQGEGTD